MAITINEMAEMLYNQCGIRKDFKEISIASYFSVLGKVENTWEDRGGGAIGAMLAVLSITLETLKIADKDMDIEKELLSQIIKYKAECGGLGS